MTNQEKKWVKALQENGYWKPQEIASSLFLLDQDLFHFCWELPKFCKEMPYGVQKARTGDPYLWIEQKLKKLVTMVEGRTFGIRECSQCGNTSITRLRYTQAEKVPEYLKKGKKHLVRYECSSCGKTGTYAFVPDPLARDYWNDANSPVTNVGS